MRFAKDSGDEQAEIEEEEIKHKESIFKRNDRRRQGMVPKPVLNYSPIANNKELNCEADVQRDDPNSMAPLQRTNRRSKLFVGAPKINGKISLKCKL